MFRSLRAKLVKLLGNEYSVRLPAVTDALRNSVTPSFTRLRDFLRDEYMPHARVGAGIVSWPGSASIYADCLAFYTGLEVRFARPLGRPSRFADDFFV